MLLLMCRCASIMEWNSRVRSGLKEVEAAGTGEWDDADAAAAASICACSVCAWTGGACACCCGCDCALRALDRIDERCMAASERATFQQTGPRGWGDAVSHAPDLASSLQPHTALGKARKASHHVAQLNSYVLSCK